MAFNVIVSPRAQALIDNIIGYVVNQLQNPTAALAIINDIEESYKILQTSASSFAYCYDPYLASKEYRKISLKHHDYVVLYTVVGNEVHVAGIYHMLENYRTKL